jgi:HEAT repeat protein
VTADRPASADTAAEAPRGLDLDVDPPPDDLPYAAYEDYRYREICRRNAIAETPEALTRALRLDEPTLRAAAAHTIGSLGMVAALPALEEAVGTSDDLVAAEVGYALARLGAESGRPVLESCLTLPMNAYVAPPLAAGYLAQLGDPRGAPVVGRGLASDNSTVRMIATKQLAFFVPFDGEMSADGSVVDVWGWFRLALADPLPDVQWQAVVELGLIADPVADELLAAYAESGADPASRSRAARALEARTAD